MYTIELAALALCALGLAAAVVGGMFQLRVRREQHTPIEWPPTWAEILAKREEVSKELALIAPEKPVRHRHNIHCATCGRFAKVVPELPGAGFCRYHGLTARISTHTGQLGIAA